MAQQPQIKRRRQIKNPVSISNMRDAVVDEGTYSKYVNDIIVFMDWLRVDMISWLTPFCSEKYDEISLLREDEGKKERRARIKASWMNLVKNASSNPLINIDQMTPAGVMQYMRLQANQKTGKYLSNSSYKTKRSAIRHLVRVHWGQSGWDEKFMTDLDILWRGFTRVASKERATAVGKTNRKRRAKRKRTEEDGNDVECDNSDEDGGDDADDDLSVEEEDCDYDHEEDDNGSDVEFLNDDDDDDREENQVGKSPMTPELYKSVCRWFLEWGTTDGIACACFFAFTWHLACRSNNTARIRYGHMSWTFFDALHVRFRHTKTQQHGEARRQKRACYSNPFEWYIDLPLLMGLYFATNFNTGQRRGLKLFPGAAKTQSAHMSSLFKKLLREHKDEVLAMGYDSIDELGLHSLRKGVSTHLASMPGGPTPAALCLRAGWSMGAVKDIYFHQSQGGDEFVGRCAAMLNMFNGDFASSPAFFDGDDIEMCNLADAAVEENFPHHHAMDGMKRILHRCLASMVYHRETILSLPPNHVARSIFMFCQSSPTVSTNILADHVKVVHSWETTTVLTGIPPHVKSLVDIAAIRATQDTIVDRVFDKVITGVQELLDTRKIGGGELTACRLSDMIVKAVAPQFETLKADLSQTLGRHHHPARQPRTMESSSSVDSQQPVNDLRLHGGVFSRLPKDYEFPSAGVYDLWIKWNTRDTMRGIPPLKTLHPKDYNFLDSTPKPDGSKRRASSKTYSDMKFICNCIETAAKECGMDPSDGSLTNIRLIYDQVWPSIYEGVKGGRRTQNKWPTLVDKLRKRKQREKEEEQGGG